MTKRGFHLVIGMAAAAALALCGFGCDDESSSTPTGTVTGTVTGTTGTGSGTGGTGGSGTGSGTGGGVGGAMPDGVGMVMGNSGTYMSVNSSMVMAFFSEITGGGGASGCSETTDGACTINVCNLGTGGSGGVGGGGAGGAGGAAPSPHAGEITVTGGVRDVTLTPDGMGAYASDMSFTELLFAGGETITIAAAGADIAAFSEQLTAPSLITVTAPAFTGGNVTISTGSDLSLAWTGGTDGEVMVTLGGSDSSTSTSVVCTYGASSGSGTVPTTALDDLLTYGTGSISILNGTTVTIAPSNWMVILTLSSVGASSSSPSGMSTGQATFQ